MSLGGKCRYCKKPISIQYPIVELATALLFGLSYVYWPSNLVSGNGQNLSTQLFQGATFRSDLLFVLWLVALVGLLALFVYDLRWFLLPNRIIYPLSVVAGLMALITIVSAPKPLLALINTILAVAIGGGIFYVLFQVSSGKWIGGGDVKLGWVLGLIAGTPARSMLFIFLASVIGTLLSLPLLATNRLKRSSYIPFGPLLIIGAIIMQLFGANILHWYQQFFLNI
jgi:prepilin signal peptidase PulO-like enzyme (type II secretory pathway)